MRKPNPKPIVHATLSTLSFSFSSHAVQSEMHLERPYELQFEYTQIMMGFLQHCAQPRSLLLIGLGGGSLAKFCYRFLPDTQITVLEINPHVLALREQFSVPADDHRFTVILGDAAHFVQHTGQQFDIVLADGFDEEGLPEPLSTQRFYDDCHSILTPGGMLVSNLHTCHPLCSVYLGRMQISFTQPLLQVNDPSGTNCVVFATRQDNGPRKAFTGLRRPAHFDAQAWAELAPSMGRVFLAARLHHREMVLVHLHQ